MLMFPVLARSSVFIQCLVTVVALFALAGCGGGSGGSGPTVTEANAGWITVDPPPTTTTDSAFFLLKGSAFISPDYYHCCSGSAGDTGVTVSWYDPASGMSGTAEQFAETCYFLWSPYVCNHTWAVSVPVALGGNAITVTASDPGTNTASASVQVTRVADVTPPTIKSVYPAAGAPAVPRDLPTPIYAVFSEAMSSIAPSALTLTGPGNQAIPGTFSAGLISPRYSYGQQAYTSVTFRPLADLTSCTTYTVTISGGITDYAGGNPMGAVYTWSFTTGVSVGGYVRSANGYPQSNISVSIEASGTGWHNNTSTNADGFYRFAVPPNDTYTVTPSDFWCNTCSFTPASLTVPVGAADVLSQDFIKNF